MPYWSQRVNIKQFLTNEDVGDEEAQAIAKRIHDHLITNVGHCPPASLLLAVKTQEDVNAALEHLYDWADSPFVRIWLGP